MPRQRPRHSADPELRSAIFLLDARQSCRSPQSRSASAARINAPPRRRTRSHADSARRRALSREVATGTRGPARRLARGASSTRMRPTIRPHAKARVTPHTAMPRALAPRAFSASRFEMSQASAILRVDDHAAGDPASGLRRHRRRRSHQSARTRTRMRSRCRIVPSKMPRSCSAASSRCRGLAGVACVHAAIERNVLAPLRRASAAVPRGLLTRQQAWGLAHASEHVASTDGEMVDPWDADC